ncbi:MAG: DegT/DnrJ/EryC1/StrS family aminotransferase [Gemmatimonadota bacterium]|nr:DegT/DnrJ/EryC1/StrS family aminotransferase [Gemmatimonadota bacterium]
MIKFLDLQSQYKSISGEIDEAVADVLQSATFIGGPNVVEFEREFASYQQAQHCVGVANATDGLEIALEALELPTGSEVLVPANSFIASSESVTRTGHAVRFFDPEPGTYCADAAGIEKALTPATRAVVVVHLYGQPAPMTPILDLARRKGLRVIEDAAQAHGAEDDGRRVGAIGDVGVFSFYPGKNLGAYGDGGAVTTNNAHLAKRMRMIANHGRTSKYDHEFEGRNSRLDSLQAAILRVKLRHLDSWIDARNRVATVYNDRLRNIPGLTPPVHRPGVRHSYHLYVVRTARRDALQEHLSASGIDTGIHYPVALPDLQAYQALRSKGNHFHSSTVAPQLLSLPIGEHLSIEQAEAVAEEVKRFFSRG